MLARFGQESSSTFLANLIFIGRLFCFRARPPRR